MSSIVIAEKPSQKALYERTVGDSFGRVLAARGHLFELVPPQKMNPEWSKWSDELLVPEGGFYPFELKNDPDIKKRIGAMKRAARSADTIYLATDPDREGEGIAQNILQDLQRSGFSGRVLRVLPLAEDKTSMEKAFRSAKPIEDFADLYEAFQARSQSDQIYNLSLTRAATTLLSNGGRGVISIGRVITPTLGIICQREHEITNFVPEDYFVPSITVSGDAGSAQLTMSGAQDDRIFKREEAEAIAAAANGYQGPINVVTKAKRESPPHLFSMSSLQVACGKRFKWSAKRTSELLQNLYSKYQVTTYPRSGEVSLPESEIENVEVMKSNLEAIFGPTGFDAKIRKVKGAFSDSDLKGASHFAIIPNFNTADKWKAAFGQMSAEEKKLFELISRRYLSMLGPDRLYDSTTLSVTPKDTAFKVTGTVERDPGWKRALGVSELLNSQRDDNTTNPKLPPFRDGDRVASTDTKIDAKQTTPPPRIAEAGIVDLMINAWKLIEDPQEREKLKEAKGIGTEATRDDIVANLLKRGLVRVEKGKIFATDAGMALWQILKERSPLLLDVAHTARMEMALHRIEKGDVSAKAVVDEIVGQAGEAIKALRNASTTAPKIDMSSSRAPTPKMLKFARSIAKRQGQRLPAGVSKSLAECKTYLEQHAPKSGEGSSEPSDKQLSFAKKIAEEKGAKIPEETLKDRRKLSAWIDANMTPKGSGGGTSKSSKPRSGSKGNAPSAKQLSFADTIAKRKKLKIPENVMSDGRALSKWIDKNK